MRQVLQGASKAFYRYVLPGLILYGLMVEAARQNRELFGGSPGWDLAVRLYLAAAFCGQSWIVGGTRIGYRWVAHYWQPWPEIRRDPGFVLLQGMMVFMAIGMHGSLTFLAIQGLLPSLAPFGLSIATAIGLLYALPIMANRVLWPD